MYAIRHRVKLLGVGKAKVRGINLLFLFFIFYTKPYDPRRWKKEIL
jgi:hypothetical protein